MQIGEYSPYIQYSVNISLIFFGVFEQVSAEELASAQSKLRKICCLKSIPIMVSKKQIYRLLTLCTDSLFIMHKKLETDCKTKSGHKIAHSR